ncbi:helix-turn-helix transcriptional regulator [Shewanella sp.]|uniref:helix-turn-helix transcriptional regulator n=1 Tax=Shewanella sp. TaxID=50422 RepID=UPI000C10DCB6|nr:helix-turn-helix transcriptional regulator [Shewanella sp.]MBL4815006.1 helix-turn-helix transcriptional regulator [Shewanella sp.]MCJ8302038.1 helix-turn-helix transcriptional regulator [Shewanella sp.]PHQ74447.1 MAG: transcriptional regulator [Shewanella sp.]
MKNRLKVLRAERDWTQADLADKLEVSRQTINAIEKGKFDPSLPLAFKLARLFSMSIESIFDDEVRVDAESSSESIIS